MKHKTLEQVDKERAKFRLACDYYSQLILIGEEDGESWIYWDTKSLDETETLLKSSLSYIKAQKGEEV